MSLSHNTHARDQGAGIKRGAAGGHSEQEGDVGKDKEWKRKGLEAPLSAAAVLNKGTAGKGPGGDSKEGKHESKEGKNARGRPAKAPKPSSPQLSSHASSKRREKVGAIDSLAPLSPFQEKRVKSEALDATLCKPERSSAQEVKCLLLLLFGFKHVDESIW